MTHDADPPHVIALRRIEAMLAAGETPSLLDAVAACPPDADETSSQRVLVMLAPLVQRGGLLGEFIERRFAVELEALRIAGGINVVAEVERG